MSRETKATSEAAEYRLDVTAYALPIEDVRYTDAARIPAGKCGDSQGNGMPGNRATIGTSLTGGGYRGQ